MIPCVSFKLVAPLRAEKKNNASALFHTLRRIDYTQSGEVSSIKTAIASKQTIRADEGVGTNQKVSSDSIAGSAARYRRHASAALSVAVCSIGENAAGKVSIAC